MWRRLPIILVVGVAMLVLAEAFGPGGVQRRGNESGPIVPSKYRSSACGRSAICSSQDDRHYPSEPSGVCEVPDETALADLQRLVQAPADAPFRVVVHAEVRDLVATRPAD